MSDELTALTERLKRLQAEAQVLLKAAPGNSRKLKMLLLKNDLQELLRELRKGQAGVGQQRSSQLAASTAATAYAAIHQLQKAARRK